jgi:hypothetical protein
MPRVLNFHDFKRGGLPSRAVYIGRANPTYGLPASKWANKFMIGRDGAREKVIETYERWLRDERPDLMAAMNCVARTWRAGARRSPVTATSCSGWPMADRRRVDNTWRRGGDLGRYSRAYP